MWEYKCPCCNSDIKEAHSLDMVRQNIGATHDCPECNGLLMIEEDLSCSDFGEELVRRYKGIGLDVSKEQATGTFIEF